MRSRASRGGPSLVVAFASLALSACYSKITAHDGKMTLAYASGVQIENFVKPIAPGAKLDVVARTNGKEEPLSITKAASSRPDVIAIDAVVAHHVTLRGVAPGVADIEVTAHDDGGTVFTDRMFFQVAAPSSHRLEHACTEEAEAAYVREDFVDVLHDLATAEGRPVIGYGFAPVRVEPPGALELVAQPQGAALYRFRAPAPNPRITLRSTVDQRALTMRVVERRDITVVKLDYPDRMVEGHTSYAVANAELGDTPLCSQSALTRARSLTPETCRVTAKLDDSLADENRYQLAEISAQKFGACEFEVTLPELAGGRGVVLRGKTSIGRIRYPGDSAAPAPRPWWTWLPLDWILSALAAVGLGTAAYLRRRRHGG